MSKRKGFDPIADANELAQHNFPTPYWLHRVTSYTYASWMVQKRLAIYFLPLYGIVWFLLIKSAFDIVNAKHESLWKVWFNFNNTASLAFLVQILFLLFYTIVYLVMAIQFVLASKKKPVIEDPIHKQQKKKQPKRRKDYGRN